MDEQIICHACGKRFASARSSRRFCDECRVERERARSAKRRLDPEYRKKKAEQNRVYMQTERAKRLNSIRCKRYNQTESAKAKNAKRAKERRSNDNSYRLRCRIRSRLKSALNSGGYKKGSKTELWIGTSWDELIKYIESLFEEGMSWSNSDMWHIDHIKPLAMASDEEGLRQLSHYTNLRPMWISQNLSRPSDGSDLYSELKWKAR